ncbi:SpaA isopeptide-forming pilin-related protein [Xiamenia xianingshaonis]|uniref:SpaA isopeptide-forming pilin-related protein n=1 Tax=Xiamenia xianingshaonis TaxID=2682776 RepID=UPI00140B33B5|nr:SpaA isopeptide-forming pilin-related protein [Xiamenia xianingshaonis]
MNDKKKRYREMGFFALAAVMVVLCVVVWLHIEGIATTNEAMCGIPEHAHSEACYTVEYTCDSAEDPDHTHTDECTVKTLTCDMEEHTHDVSCYSNPEADVETPEQWAASTEGANLTGDWASDLVAVAQTQIGYAESDQNFQVGEDGERHGYTRYGAWNDNPYGAWDSLFVGFCLDYANVEVNKVPRESGAYAWTAALQRAGAYTPAAGYTPEAGDIVFFDEDGNGKADHTAVVSHVNSDLAQMNIIEGDVNNAVVEEDRTIGESTVLGYCNIAGMQERAESPDGGVVPINEFDPDNASNTKQNMDGEPTDSDESKKPAATTTEGGTDPATNTKGEGETDVTGNNGKPATESGGTTDGGTGAGAGTTEGEGSGTTEPTDPAAGQQTDKPADGAANNTQSPDKQPVSETGKEQQIIADTEKKDPAATSDDTSIVEEEEKLEKLEAGAAPALSDDSEQTGEGELPDSDEFAAGAALIVSDELEVDGLGGEAGNYSMLRLALRMGIAPTPLFLSLGDDAGAVGTSAARSSRSSGGVDFKDNITGITVEYRPDKNTNTWVTIDPDQPGTVVSEDGQLKFKIDYNLPSGTLSAGRDTIYYQLPTNIKLMQEEFGFVYDSGNAKVGTYRISEDGLVTITFDEVYVAKNATNDIEGFINVTCDIKQLNQADGTTVKLPFDDKHEFGITIEKTETAEADLDVVKEKPTYNEAEGTLEYTVVVKSTKGTTNTVTLQDIMNGLEFDGPVTIVRKNADGNELSETTVNPTGNILNWTSDQKMEPGETYTFTYKAKVSGTVNGTTTVKNSALVSSKKDNTTLTDFASVDTTVKREMLSKTHTEGSEAGKIAWEVTVNKAQVNIDGWTLTDKVNDEKFTGNITVKCVNQDGSTVDVFTGALPENGLTFGTDIAGKNYDPCGTYVITYETDDELALGQTAMRNTATMTPPGNGDKPGISVTDQGEARPGLSWEGYNPLKKEGVSSVEQADKKTALNTWKMTVNASEGGLNGPWTLTDELQGNQWFTKAQIEDILAKAKEEANAQMSSGAVAIKVYKYENGWTGSEVGNWQNVEDGKYRKFELTFEGALPKGASLNFEYVSTADIANAKGPLQFSNNSSLHNVGSNATVEYRPSNPTLIKEDSKAPGSANTSHSYKDNGGVFEWALKVSMPADYQGGDVTLKEQLPDGVELDHFTMVGNGLFSDVELKGQNVVNVKIGEATYQVNVAWNGTNGGPVYTVTIPEKLATATDANGKRITEFKFLVGVKVAGNAQWTPNANDSGIKETVLANTATITTKNNDYTSTATQTQIIKKDERTDVIDKQHIGSDWTGEFDGNTIPYRVDVNKDKKELLKTEGTTGAVTSKTLKFVDTLTIRYPKDGSPFAATLVPHSVRILKVEGEGASATETDITDQYSYTYDEETTDNGWEWVKNYKLEIEIPDATHVAIEYKYKIQGTGGEFTTIKNTAGLHGLTTVKQDNEDSTNFQVTESEAGANIRGISVYKIDAENASLYLRDAKFKLYRYNPSSPAATEDGKFVEECDLVTDINGVINYSNIEYNVAYKLVETEAPAGYECNTDPYYFYVYHKDTGKHPKKVPASIEVAGKGYTCNMLLPGEGIRIKDNPNNQDKKTANLTLKKVDSTSSAALEGATFRLWEYRINKNDEGKVTGQGYEPIDEFYTSDQLGQIKLTNLRYNTAYMLEEIKAPAGYVKRTEPIYLCVDKADIDEEKYPAAKPAGFVATDFTSDVGLGIENPGAENEIKLIKNTTKSANVKVNKVWKDAEGNVITDPEVDSIGVTLKRKMVALEESLRRGLPATELTVYKYNKQDDCLLKTMSLSGKDVEVDDRVKITIASQHGYNQKPAIWGQGDLRVLADDYNSETKTYTIDAVVTGRKPYLVIDQQEIQQMAITDEDSSFNGAETKATLKADNEPEAWAASWSNLDLLDDTGKFKYEYYVVEDEKIPYYDAQEPTVETTTDADGNTAYAITLTNQKRPDPTEITINKAWTDETGNPIEAPDNIDEVAFDLYRVWCETKPQDNATNSCKVDAVVSCNGASETIHINNGDPLPKGSRVKLAVVNKWGITEKSSNLEGTVVTWNGWNAKNCEDSIWSDAAHTAYTVNTDSAQYTYGIKGDDSNATIYTYEFTVTEDTELTIDAQWKKEDIEWQTPEITPPAGSEASLDLTQKEPVGTYTVSKADHWKKTIPVQFSGKKNGQLGYYYYFVEEKNVPKGFMSVVEEQGLPAGNAFEVTNKKVKTAKLDVEKKWLDANGKETEEGLPESLKVKVKRYRTLELNQVPVMIKLTHYWPEGEVAYSQQGLVELGSTVKVSMTLPTQYAGRYNDELGKYSFGNVDYIEDTTASKKLTGKYSLGYAVYSKTYENVGSSGLTIQSQCRNELNITPDQVVITETSGPGSYDAADVDPFFEQELTLTAGEGWKKQTDDLPSYGTGEDGKTYYYHYFIAEDEPLDGFIQDYEQTNNNGGITNGTITLVNKPDTSEKTSITVKKNWKKEDGSDQNKTDGSVTLNLHQLRKEASSVKLKIVNAYNAKLEIMSKTIDNVGIDDAVQIIMQVDEYNGSISENNGAKVSGLKDWKVEEKVEKNQYGMYTARQLIVTGVVEADEVVLPFAGESGYIKSIVCEPAGGSDNATTNALDIEFDTITIEAKDNWSHTFDKLPKTYYDPVEKKTYNCTYYVTEMPVPGYKLDHVDGNNSTDGIESGTITLTNKEAGKTQVAVNKKWVNNDDPDGGAVQLKLIRYAHLLPSSGTELKVRCIVLNPNIHYDEYMQDVDQGDKVKITVKLREDTYDTLVGMLWMYPINATGLVDVKTGVDEPTHSIWVEGTVDKDPSTPILVEGYLLPMSYKIENSDVSWTFEKHAGVEDSGGAIVEVYEQYEPVTVSKNQAGNWEYLWGDLPTTGKFDGKDVRYTYEVEEVPSNDYEQVGDTEYAQGEDGGIVATITNRMTSLVVEKQWFDANGTAMDGNDSTLPDSIDVTLKRYRTEKEVPSNYSFAASEADPDFNEPKKLEKAKGWKLKLDNLTAKETKDDGKTYYYYYYVVEKTPITGFTLDSGHIKNNDGVQSGTITLANKVDNSEKTKFTVHKKWTDGEKECEAPADASVQVQLYQVANAGTSGVGLTVNGKKYERDWRGDWGNTDQDVNYNTMMSGVKIGDIVRVTIKNICLNRVSTGFLRSYYEPESNPEVTGLKSLTELGVSGRDEALWIEGEVTDASVSVSNVSVQEGFNPARDVTVTIIKAAGQTDKNDGLGALVPYGDPVSLSSSAGWSKTWSNLPKTGTIMTDDGNARNVDYMYVVKELESGGYQQVGTTAYSPEGTEATITNKVSDKTSITVQKVWQDSNGADISNDKTGSSVTVTLMQQKFDEDGNKVSNQPYGGPDTVIYGSADQPWKHTYEDLPLTGIENGEKYTYKYYVKEKIAQENTNYQWISMTTDGDGSQPLATIENNEIKGEVAGVTSGTIVITNKEFEEPGYVLPATGGTGVVPYWALGSLLVAAGALGIACRRRFGRLGERRSE